MMTKVYDLEERLINFAIMVIDVVELLPTTRAGNHIAGQLLRSGTSPAPNYGESQSAESKKDFIHKIKLALKELRESRVWLKMIYKKNYIQPNEIVLDTLNECEELIRILSKSVITAESKT